jgi:hypothetical protein
LLASIVVLSTSAQAAEVTRVASSFEEKHPFGLTVDFSFLRRDDFGTIAREWYLPSGSVVLSELRHARSDSALGMEAHIGLYHDLELHLALPIVFQQDRTWAYASGNDADHSTLNMNCADARGTACATPGSGTAPLFPFTDPTSSYRSGLGDFTAGLAWAPLVQAKDAQRPTWSARFDYTAPTAALLNPSIPTAAKTRGGIGDKMHRFTFSTELSRRVSIAEPYVKVQYTLPAQGAGYYSNCVTGSNETLGRVENCTKPGWEKSRVGALPQHVAAFEFGSELSLYELPERFQRFVVDVRGIMRYVSEGRTANQLTDLMGKLLYSSDYAQLGGQLALIGQAAQFFQLKATAALLYDTQHFLTNETLGRDIDGDSLVDFAATSGEVNPNFDYRVDATGRRFLMWNNLSLRINVTASFLF